MKHIILFCIAFTAQAKVLNFETTRMKSTAGAGNASLLMNESTLNNPAPIAFFKESSLYFERSAATYSGEENSQELEASNYAFIASDASKNLRGSVALIKHNEGPSSLEQFNVSLASTIGKSSSMGIAYRNVQKEYDYRGTRIREDYKIFVPGVFHAVSNDLSIGLTLIDPTRESINETKAVVGFQYRILDMMLIMLDLGADYEGPMSDTSVVRAATQIKVFDDFFLRFGAFEDKDLKERGTGFGVGWVGPKLVFNFAIRNTKVSESEELRQENQDIKDTSFSVAYRF